MSHGVAAMRPAADPHLRDVPPQRPQDLHPAGLDRHSPRQAPCETIAKPPNAYRLNRSRIVTGFTQLWGTFAMLCFVNRL